MSDLSPPTQKKPSVVWRLFFTFNSLLIFLNILSVPYLKYIGPLEIIDFVFTNIAFVGLCGYILAKPFGKVAFWRYFFYAAIIEALLVLALLPLVGYSIYGEPTSLGWTLFNIVNTVIILIAINLYAYKARTIWE